MGEPNYSVVTYLSGELGDFVNDLRQRLDPGFAGCLVHVTILPPRPLQAAPKQTVEMIRKRCALLEPFVIAIDGVASFWPVNGFNHIE